MQRQFLFVSNLIFLLSCQSKQPSYELYQEVIQTVIEADSLDTNNFLSLNLEKIKPFLKEKEVLSNIAPTPPNIDEVDVEYLLINFNSFDRELDSLFIINQFEKKCYFKIDEKLNSRFSGKAQKWYSFMI